MNQESGNQNLSVQDTEVKFFGTIFLLLVLLLALSFLLGGRVDRTDVSKSALTATRSFPSVEVEARSAYLYDARTKEVLYAKNEHERLSLASVTKLMTALVAMENASGHSPVVITREALLTEGDSGLRGGERWRLRDLLDFSLVTSSNDGMQAVALALNAVGGALEQGSSSQDNFILKMNEKASELNLKNTYYFNSTGLDESDLKGGAYGSASDMARLLEYILTYRSSLLEATRYAEASFTSLSGVAHEAKNTNVLASMIPGSLGSKTGYTDIGGGNLVFAFDPEIGRPIIVVVLGSTAEGRFRDAEKLIDATMEYLTGESLSTNY